MKWAVVNPQGALSVREDEPSLLVLQDIVGGELEAMHGPDPLVAPTVFVNERGEARNHDGLPLNPKATVWMTPVLWPGDRIVGSIAITGEIDQDGLITPLSDEQVARLQGVFGATP